MGILELEILPPPNSDGKYPAVAVIVGSCHTVRSLLKLQSVFTFHGFHLKGLWFGSDKNSQGYAFSPAYFGAIEKL